MTRTANTGVLCSGCSSRPQRTVSLDAVSPNTAHSCPGTGWDVFENEVHKLCSEPGSKNGLDLPQKRWPWV